MKYFVGAALLLIFNVLSMHVKAEDLKIKNTKSIELVGAYDGKHDQPKKKVKRLKINSVPATGFNRYKGQPLFNLGGFGELGFETLGQLSPSNTMPVALNNKHGKETVLATYVDTAFTQNFMNGESGDNLEPSHLNLPLRESVANFLPTGNGYFTPPAVTDVNPEQIFQGAQSLPANTITLGDWEKAQGKLKFVCKPGKHPKVKLTLSGLIPRRIYTVWGFFETEDKTLPFNDFGPIRALGGVSNAVVADEFGRAEFKRLLNFCPMALKEGEVPLSTVFVYFHSDQAVYGAVMSHPGAGRYPGASGHVQLHFPVTATPVKKIAGK